jgi:hypothetical protein
MDSETGEFRVYFANSWATVGSGPIGATGPVGATGIQGNIGLTGSTGPQGATGVNIVTSYIFEGGAPTTNYTNGPAFDCGGVN